MGEARTVLVTGGLGFTGRYAAAKLIDAGWDVHVLAREERCSQRNVARGNVHNVARGNVHSADLRDPEGLAAVVDRVRPTHVLHLAGSAFVGAAERLPFYDIHAVGTDNLLAALERHARRIRKVILASSAGVYGDPGPRPVSESACPAPRNHYGCSKLAMEHIAGRWTGRLPLVTARPFNYTGPGQDERFLVPKIVSHFVRRDAVIELGNLSVSRDFSDVRDVAGMYHRLLESDADSLAVNICSGRVVSLQRLLDLCRRITKHEPEIRSNPQYRRAAEVPCLVGDGMRLEALIGPMERRPLEQTLIDMVRDQGCVAAN